MNQIMNDIRQERTTRLDEDSLNYWGEIAKSNWQYRNVDYQATDTVERVWFWEYQRNTKGTIMWSNTELNTVRRFIEWINITNS